MANRMLTNSVKFAASAIHLALAASANGTGVDATGFEQALIVCKLGTTTGTSATAKIQMQECDTVGGSYTSITAAVTATQSLDAGAGTGKTLCVQMNLSTRTKAFVRYNIVLAGTTPVAGDVAMTMLFGSPKHSQVSSQFDVFVSA